MATATFKLTINKHKREAFNLIKMASKSAKQKGIALIIQASKKKQINCINIWLKNTKVKNKMFEEESKIRDIQKKFLSKLLLTKTGRIVDALRKWKGIPEKKNLAKYLKATKF